MEINMKTWIKYNIKLKNLIILFLIIIIGFVAVENSIKRVHVPYYQLQVEAARVMTESLYVIKEEREAKGIVIDEKLDPNKTGLIGEEYTLLTTTLGNLSAKRTSTNPDFAALMVKYFYEAGLQSGDIVAIGSSGSFPALLIATLSACKSMELAPLIIYSIGASEYGATIPELTFIDMLETLRENKVLPYKILAVSMGGNKDQAESMLFPESVEIIRDIAKKTEAYFIDIEDLSENIQKRMEIYKEAAGEKPIKVFVNIGGASVNYGNTSASITYPNGLVINGPKIPDNPERGLIFEYQLLNIPVIHLLNVRDLALKNGIPIDPIPLPEIGTSQVFFQNKAQKWIIVLIILISAIYLFLAKNNKE